MIRFFTSSKSLCLLVLLVLATIAAQGCSSGAPKGGVAIQAGDYVNAPGGGGNPNKKAN
jgi:hypothetical protein